MQIAQTRIRVLYYTGTVSIVLMILAVMGFSSVLFYTSQTQQKIRQLAQVFLDMKKVYLQDAIDRTIQHIEIDRRRIEGQCSSRLNPEEIERQVKAIATDRIRQERLADNGYIWINWVIDYEGGDNYAIRLVHPNLPETEGSYLSTKTQDIKGNLPYLAELEGIKKDGAAYNEYYFKKLGSEDIAHKLTYAKLYKPFGWIVATGVYLDDIDALTEAETRSMRRAERSFILRFIGLGVLVLSLALALIVLFEQRLSALIQGLQGDLLLKNSELEEEKRRIEDIAYLDPLTGLLNRRAILDLIERAVAGVRRGDPPFSVAIADVDRFKLVNDEFGHLAGDRVLASIAETLRTRLRGIDAVSRWGGEEFLILVPSSSESEAAEGMNRVREILASSPVVFEGLRIPVTVSFGVAGWNEGLTSVTELIKLADSRLYAAKEGGRNRVVAG